MSKKPAEFLLSNDDPNCPYIVIKSETQRSPKGEKYLFRIKSPWDYDEVFDDEDIPKIAVVDRSQTNNGINLYLRHVKNYVPFPKGSIMVPIGDTNPLMARLIPRDFYTERDQYVLIPKPWYEQRMFLPIGNWEKMNHIQQIRDQSWRFGKGYSPVNHFNKIKIQHVGKKEVIKRILTHRGFKKRLDYSKFRQHYANLKFKNTNLSEIGSIESGKRLVAKRDLDFPKDDDPGHPYITAQKTNNMNNMGGGNVGINSKRVLAFNFDTGYAGYQTTVEVGEKVPPNGKGETISFAFDGSVGHAAYQHEPYYGGTQVGIITLKKDYNFKEMGLFVAFSLSAENWRYDYKRKCYKNRFGTLTCLLPYKDGKIDVEGIKKLMKTLPKWAEVFPK